MKRFRATDQFNLRDGTMIYQLELGSPSVEVGERVILNFRGEHEFQCDVVKVEMAHRSCGAVSIPNIWVDNISNMNSVVSVADESLTALEWDDVDWETLGSDIFTALKKSKVDQYTRTPVELLHCLVVDVIQSFASVKDCLDVVERNNAKRKEKL